MSVETINNLQHVITEHYSKWDKKIIKSIYIISPKSMESVGRRANEIVFIRQNRCTDTNGEYSGANIIYGYLRRDVMNGIMDSRRTISIYNIKVYANSYEELVEEYPEYLI